MNSWTPMNMNEQFFVHDVIVMVLALMVATMSLVSRFKIRFEEALPSTISFIVIWLYCFGIVGLLSAGLYILWGLILASGVITWYLDGRGGIKANVFNTLTPGFFVYLLWLIWVFVQYSEANVNHHDDFSHWALAAKNTFILNAIAVGPDANTIFQDYPPGTALLAYFLLKLKGGYLEPVLLFGMSIWGYAILAYPIKFLKWKDWKTILVYAIVGFFIPVAFRLDQNSYLDYHAYLMVDYLLALIFGYGLTLAVNAGIRYQPIDLYKLVAVIFSLVLIKQAGVFLALAVWVVALYNIAFSNRANPASNGSTHTPVLKNLAAGKIPVILSLFVFLFAYSSWKYFLKLNSVPATNIIQNFSKFSSQFLDFNFDFPKRAVDIVGIYFNALYDISLTSGPLAISFVGFYCLIIFGLGILTATTKNLSLRKSLIGNSLVMAFFLIVYLAAHLGLYVAVLSDGESYGLSSFLRYLIYFTAGIFVFGLGFSLDRGFGGSDYVFKCISYLLLLLLALSIGYPKKIEGKNNDNLKGDVVSTLERYASSNDKYMAGWAQLELEKIGIGEFGGVVDLSVVANLNQLKGHRDSKQVDDKLVLMENVANNNKKLRIPGASLCMFEGRGGSGYGYALMLRNKLAPIHIARIQSYPSSTDAEKAWHKSLFIAAAKTCSQIFVIEPNDIIRKQYSEFFATPIVNFGLYEMTWSGDNDVKLSLKDCGACDK